MQNECSKCNRLLDPTEIPAEQPKHCPACGEPLDCPDSEQTLDATIAATVPADQTVTAADSNGATVTQAHGETPSEKGISLGPTNRNVSPQSILTTKQTDKYKLGRMIARGGMGTIVDAKDVNIRRSVAMKLMLHPAEATPDQVLRFIEEAQITGQLEHPGIVPVYELGIDAGGNVFYTMKLVGGATLKQILKGLKDHNKITAAKYPLAALLTAFQKVCDAIAFAHSKGVIHRDLKPENIMVGDFGEVLVMDWGLAKVLIRNKTDGTEQGYSLHSMRRGAYKEVMMTMQGNIMGTPGYMSPEQARGETGKINEFSDIYALGAILYSILTLEAPVKGDDVSQVLDKVSRGEITPPSRYNPTMSRFLTRRQTSPQTCSIKEPDKQTEPLYHCPNGVIPSSLSAVAMKAMSFDADLRYETVKDLQADVRAYQSGFATSAEEAGLWKHIRLFIGRHKAVSIVTAMATLVLLGVLGTSYWINLRERLRAERNLADYKAEQTRRIADRRDSAPSIVQMARNMAENKDFKNAVAMLEMAMEYDSDLPDTHILNAIFLIRSGDYLTARRECLRYLLANPRDTNALNLRNICKTAVDHGADTVPVGELATIVARMGLPVLAAEFAESSEQRLELYRTRIEEAWPGLGKRLTLAENGELKCDLSRKKEAADLSTLAGIPLAELNLEGCPTANLSPLKGMRLTSLNIGGTQVSDLGPLTDMPLKSLVLSDGLQACPVTDLSPLEGMKLESLVLSLLGHACPVTDLSPLKDMPLTTLDLSGMQISDLTPLQNMPLTKLDLSNTRISNLSPLKDMPLNTLHLRYCSGVTDLSPLKDMPLTKLNIHGLENITDLSPLNNMRLTQFIMVKCRGITDLSPLNNMPLTRLDLTGCDGITNLSPLQNMPLTSLIIGRPDRITDGIQAIRNMPSLVEINACPAEEFWANFDAGAFDGQ